MISFLQGGKTVVLVFSIQGSGHFQGYARLTSDTPVMGDITLPDMATGHFFNSALPIEWVKRSNIPHHATRHLFNPYNDYAKVQMSRDGQVSYKKYIFFFYFQFCFFKGNTRLEDH